MINLFLFMSNTLKFLVLNEPLSNPISQIYPDSKVVILNSKLGLGYCTAKPINVKT